jgi:DNA modification methylase
MSYVIHQGDALERLREMKSESVHCCVTSPPYWGLRDYGTAAWQAGNAECDHVEMATGMSDKNTLGPKGFLPETNAANVGRVRQYRGICGKCGANRVDRQLGLESTPYEYVTRLVEVFREVQRVLRRDGTCWINLGDSYGGSGKGPDDKQPGIRDHTSPPYSGNGIKPKDLVGIPWMVAFALRADGWYLRSDIVWSKSNPMPESVTDRPTRAHEYIFLLSKSQRYFYNHEAIKEPAVADHGSGNGYKRDARLTYDGRGSDKPYVLARDSFRRENSKRGQPQFGQTVGTHRPDRKDTLPSDTRNKRSVWEVATKPFAEAHFATFPPELIKPCVLAGSPAGGVVLDPFCGSATTGVVATQWTRDFIGIELNPEYVEMGRRRIEGQNGKMTLYQLIEAKERQGALLDG